MQAQHSALTPLTPNEVLTPLTPKKNKDMDKKELQVAALENGTVIDHIPAEKVFTVVSLLGLQDMKTPITIGANLESKKLGRKGIIKVADRFFTDEEISRLSVVASSVKLNIIRNYEVVEKKTVITKCAITVKQYRES